MNRLKNGILVFIIIMITLSVNVSAAVTDTYVYDKDDETIPAPNPVQVVENLRGEDLGIGNFSEPQDLCFSDSGELYLADTGNNRIVIIKNA